MDTIGTYEKRRFPAHRIPTVDWLDIAQRRHHIPCLFEADVTLARRRIHDLKARTGEGLSFTGWVVACLGRAVSEHKAMHALRKGTRELILFDDVDVSIVVERTPQEAGRPAAQTLPMPYVIRRANAKSVRQIHDEIRAAQAQHLEERQVSLAGGPTARLTTLFAALPKALRHLLVWRRMFRDPFQIKRTMGTVVVTSVGMFGGSGSAWAIPTGNHPLLVALGGIARKPAFVGDAVEAREFLCVTVMFDHDVTDGAPVARFVVRLKELLEAAYGLDE